MSTRVGVDREWDWSEVRGVCLREAQRVLGPGAAAEDAAQEASVRAWRQRRTCRAQHRPLPWVRTIARHEAVRLAGERRHEPVEEAGAALAGPSHEADVVLATDVRRAVAGLAEDDRRLLGWRFWCDLPHAEVAERLGVTEAAAKVRLHRVSARLRGSVLEQA